MISALLAFSWSQLDRSQLATPDTRYFENRAADLQ